MVMVFFGHWCRFVIAVIDYTDEEDRKYLWVGVLINYNKYIFNALIVFEFPIMELFLCPCSKKLYNSIIPDTVKDKK